MSSSVETQVKNPRSVEQSKKTRWSVKQDHSLLYIVLICSVVLLMGWVGREDSTLSPQDGLGYALGIIGGSLMLILLFYPLRKHARFMKLLGPVKTWFKIHMFFGVLGPVLVMFHANFELGSVNSNIALFSMITVALSGLVGRFFYMKIHFGLYGKKANFQELRSELQVTRGKLGDDIVLSQHNTKQIARFEKSLLKNRMLLFGILHLPINVISARWLKWRVYRSIKRSLRKQAHANSWDKKMTHELLRKAHYALSQYTFSLRKIAEFNIYSQLFSIWHYAHLPLFFLLIITGILHVVVVHAY